MKWFNYSLIVFVFLSVFSPKAEALDIQYGTTLGSSGSSILVQYYGIGKKQNFLCNVSKRSCESTKKQALGTPSPVTLKKALSDELKERKASHITLSPSKNLLAFYIAGTQEKPNRSFIVRDMKTNAEYSISNSVSYWDLVGDQGRVFAFTPDSKKLLYLDDRDGVLSLYQADMTTLSGPVLKNTKLSTQAYQIDDFIFTDSKTLYYIGNTKANPYLWSLYRYNMTTDKDVVLAKNVSYADALVKVGSSVIFNQLQAKGYGPSIYNTSSKKVELFKIPNISTKSSILNEETIKTDTVAGVLMTPTKIDKTKTYPLLIWLHGGPYRQSSYGFHPYHSYGIYDSILELLCKNNVIVMKLDYKGSFGFGRDYAEGIRGTVGQSDVTDVMNAITYVKSRFKTNDTYLSGNSYGGYLSLRALVEHPYSFASVFSINGVTDWETLLVKLKVSIFNTQFNGIPNDTNRNLYDQASIASRIGILGNQKIIIAQGQSDRTIPPWQAEELYDKLKTANKNVEIIRYPGEDHVFKEKSAISDLCIQMFNFVGITPDKDCTK